MAKRVDVEINATLSGLERGIQQALAPIEAMMNKVALQQGKGQQNLKLNEAGASQLTKLLKEQSGGLLDEAKLKKVEDALQRVVKLQGQSNIDFKNTDVDAFVTSFAGLQEALKDTVEGMGDAYKDVATQADGRLQELRKFKDKLGSFKANTSKGRYGAFQGDLSKSFTAFDKTLADLSKNGGYIAERLKDAGFDSAYIGEIRRELADIKGSKTKAGNIDLSRVRSVFASMDDFMDEFSKAEADIMRRVDNLDALSKLDVSSLDGLDAQGGAAIRNKKIDADADFSRRYSKNRLNEQAFEAFTGSKPDVSSESFTQFSRYFGPTVEAFNQELKNVFSNVLGGLGAAAIFLTVQSVAQTSQDIAGLTHNMEIYERLLDTGSEGKKAKQVKELRGELEQLSAQAGITLTELGELLTQLERRDIDTSGLSNLFAQAQTSSEKFGGNAKEVLSKSVEQFRGFQQKGVDVDVYSNLISNAGKYAQPSLDAFNKLLETTNAMTFSYNQLAAAAIYYGKTGFDVTDSQTRINDAVQKGTELVTELQADTANALNIEPTNILDLVFGKPSDISQMQRDLSAQIKASWEGLLKNLGFSGESRVFATVQTVLLGVLKTLESIAGAIHALGNVPGLGQILGAAQVLLTLGAINIGLGFTAKLVKFLVIQFGDLRAASQALSLIMGAEKADSILGAAKNIRKEFTSFLGQGAKGFATLSAEGKNFAAVMSLITNLAKGVGPLLLLTGAFAVGSFALNAIQKQRNEDAANKKSYDEQRDAVVTAGVDTDSFLESFNGLSQQQRELVLSGAGQSIPGADEALSLGNVTSIIENVAKLKNKAIKADKEARELFAKLRSKYNLTESDSDLADGIYSEGFIPSLVFSPEDIEAYYEAAGQFDLARKNLADLAEVDAKLNSSSAGDEIDNVRTILGQKDLQKNIEASKAYSLEKYDAATDESKLTRFQNQTGQAQAVIEGLKNVRTNFEDEPVKLREIDESIAEQYGIIAEARLGEANQLYTLEIDKINLMTNSTARYAASLSAQNRLLDSSKAALEAATNGTENADVDTVEQLKNTITRQQNDVKATEKALAAYTYSLGRASSATREKLQNVLEPATFFVTDSQSMLYKLYNAASDELKAIESAPREEAEGRLDALRQELAALTGTAVNYDSDKRFADRALSAVKKIKNEAEQIAELRKLLGQAAQLQTKAGQDYLLREIDGEFSALTSGLESLSNKFTEGASKLTSKGQGGVGNAFQSELGDTFKAYEEFQTASSDAVDLRRRLVVAQQASLYETVTTLLASAAATQASVTAQQAVVDALDVQGKDAGSLAEYDAAVVELKRLQTDLADLNLQRQGAVAQQGNLSTDLSAYADDMLQSKADTETAFNTFIDELITTLPTTLKGFADELANLSNSFTSSLNSTGLRDTSPEDAFAQKRATLAQLIETRRAELVQGIANLQAVYDRLNAYLNDATVMMSERASENLSAQLDVIQALIAALGGNLDALSADAEQGEKQIRAEEEQAAIDKLVESYNKLLARYNELEDKATALGVLMAEQLAAKLDDIGDAIEGAVNLKEVAPEKFEEDVEANEGRGRALTRLNTSRGKDFANKANEAANKKAAEAQKRYALETARIGLMEESTERYTATVDAATELLAGTRAALALAQGNGADAATVETLKDSVAQQELSVLATQKALSGYAANLVKASEATRDKVRGVVEPATLFLDSSSTLYKLLETASQEVEALGSAPHEEAEARLEALLGELDTAVSQAKAADSDKRFIDGALAAVKNAKSTAKRVQQLQALLGKVDSLQTQAGRDSLLVGIGTELDSASDELSKLSETFNADAKRLTVIDTSGVGGKFSADLSATLTSYQDFQTSSQAAATARAALAAAQQQNLEQSVAALDSDIASLESQVTAQRAVVDSLESASQTDASAFVELGTAEGKLGQLESKLEAKSLARTGAIEQISVVAAELKTNLKALSSAEAAVAGDFVGFIESLSARLPALIEGFNIELTKLTEGFTKAVDGTGLRDVSESDTLQGKRQELGTLVEKQREELTLGIKNLEEAKAKLTRALNERALELGFAQSVELGEQIANLDTALVSANQALTGLDADKARGEKQLKAEEDKLQVDKLAEQYDKVLAEYNALEDKTTDGAKALLTRAEGLFKSLNVQLGVADALKEVAPDIANTLSESVQQRGVELDKTQLEREKQLLTTRIDKANAALSDAESARSGNPYFETLLEGKEAEVAMLEAAAEANAATEAAIASGKFKPDEVRSLRQSQASQLETVGNALGEKLGNELLSNPEKLRDYLASKGLSGDEIGFVVTKLLNGQIQSYLETYADEATRGLQGIDTSKGPNDATFQNRVGTTRAKLLDVRALTSRYGDVFGAEFETKLTKDINPRLTETGLQIAQLGGQAAIDYASKLFDSAQRATSPKALVQELSGALATTEQLSLGADEDTKKALLETARSGRDSLQEALIILIGEASSEDLGHGVEGLLGNVYAGLSQESIDALDGTALQKAFDERLNNVSQTVANTYRARFERLKGEFGAKAEANPEAAIKELGDVTQALFDANAAQIQTLTRQLENPDLDGADKKALQEQLRGAFTTLLTDYADFGSGFAASIESLAGVIPDEVLESGLLTLETLTSTIPGLALADFEQLAEQLGLAPESVTELITAILLKVNRQIKETREDIEALQIQRLKAANLLDGSLTDEQISLRGQALDLNDSKFETPQDRVSFGESAGSFASNIVDELGRQESERFKDARNPEQRALVATLNNLDALLSALREDLAAQLGLDVSSEQFAFIVAALQRERNGLGKEVASLKSVFEELVTGIVGSLESGFVNFLTGLASLPAQYYQDESKRRDEEDEISFRLGLNERQLKDYQRLREEAIATYGAASQEAQQYNEKIVEARQAHEELNHALEKSKESAKSFFDYLIEAVNQFLQTFLQAVAQMGSQKFVGSIFDALLPGGGPAAASPVPANVGDGPGIVTASTGELSTASFASPQSLATPQAEPAPKKQKQPGGIIEEQAQPQGGIDTAGLLGTGASVGISLGSKALLPILGGGFPALAGITAAGLALSAAIGYISNLLAEYGDLEQSHALKGKNKYRDNPEYNIIDTDNPKRVTVNIRGELDRQRLAREASAAVYKGIGNELID